MRLQFCPCLNVGAAAPILSPKFFGNETLFRNEHVAYTEAMADFQGNRFLSFYQHSLLQPDLNSGSLTTDL